MGDMALLLTLAMELLRLTNMVHPMRPRMMDMVPPQPVLIVDMVLQLIVDMVLLLTLDMELLRLVNMVHPMKARMMDMVPQQLVLIVDMALQLIVVMVLQLVVLTLDTEPLRAVQELNMELQLTVATAHRRNMVLL